MNVRNLCINMFTVNDKSLYRKQILYGCVHVYIDMPFNVYFLKLSTAILKSACESWINFSPLINLPTFIAFMLWFRLLVILCSYLNQWLVSLADCDDSFAIIMKTQLYFWIVTQITSCKNDLHMNSVQTGINVYFNQPNNMTFSFGSGLLGELG